MRTSLETDRLLIRELQPSDDEGMFALDSDPEVFRYLGTTPLTSIEQSRSVITMVRQQYLDNGIGRWATIEKESGLFIGWSGLKLENKVNGHSTFYDIGYRLRRQFWGKGYATEATLAWMNFAFNEMKIPTINAYADNENLASRRVLEKCGLVHTESFYDDGVLCCWFEAKNRNEPLVD